VCISWRTASNSRPRLDPVHNTGHQMKGFSNSRIARGILPYAATVLSLSLAVTLRIERPCSGGEAYDARRVTNFMNSDSASREGCTSSPSPKNRQKLMMSGRQRAGSMCGRVE